MALVQVRLNDKTVIWAEAEDTEPGRRGPGNSQTARDQHRSKPKFGEPEPVDQIEFQKIISTIKSVTQEMSGAFDGPGLGPDAYELTFGVKLSAEAGVIFAKTSGEASFEVKLSWDRRNPAKPPPKSKT